MIDWDAPFCDVLKAWIKASGHSHAAAADVLHVKVETLRGWLYEKKKSQCPYPEAFKRLMALDAEKNSLLETSY